MLRRLAGRQQAGAELISSASLFGAVGTHKLLSIFLVLA